MTTITTEEGRIPGDQPNALSLFFSRAFTVNWEVLAYLAIFVLAIFTRFYLLGERTMSHDESLHTQYSFNLYERGDFQHTPLMHGPILFHLTALSYWLFGATDFSARIYTALLGVAVVMSPLLFRRWLGRTGAILAAIMLLASPLMLYYSRYIRHDIPSIISTLLMFYAIMMYLSGPENQRRRAHWLYLLAGAMIWNLGSKETAFIYIAVFGLFLTIYWLIRVAQYLYDRIPGRVVIETFVVSGLLGGVAALAMIAVINISLSNQILPAIGGLVSDGVTLSDRLAFISQQFGNLLSGQPVTGDFLAFLAWSGLVTVVMLAIVIIPATWAYRDREHLRFSMLDIGMGFVAVLLFLALFNIFSGSTTQIIDGVEVVTNHSAAAFAFSLLVVLSIVMVYMVFRFGGKHTPGFRRQLLIILALMFVVFAGLIVIEELSHVSGEDESEVVSQPVPGEEGTAAVETTSFTVLPLIASWLIGIAGIGALLYGTQRGMWGFLRNFPEFDILLVMGTLILPWIPAIFIVTTGASAEDFIAIGEGVGGLSRIMPVSGPQAIGQFLVGFIAWLPMMVLAIVAGVLWDWRRWLIAAAIFHAIFAFFFTTVFTNIEGLASGMVYSLQYWLEQQEVRRGNQPQYYYLLIIMPLYEFLPVIGGFLAMIAGMLMFWRRFRLFDAGAAPDALEETATAMLESRHVEDEDGAEPSPDDDAVIEHRRRWHLFDLSFLLFVAFWAVVNLYGYTLAGEKMPWLGTHLTLPLILLTGWFFGRIFERIDLGRFLNRGWVYLFLLPFLLVGVFQLLAPYFDGRPPFAGTSQVELERTYSWLAVALIVGVILYLVYRIVTATGWNHLRRMTALVIFSVLAVLTFRSAWMASFINHDEATEFLVYAHAGPANKAVTEQLADLSFRITDGMDLRVMHDDKFSWPGSWYLRDFNNALYIGSNAPTQQQLDDTVAVIVGSNNRAQVEPLLEDSFQRFDHIRMWWPIQDYFDLNTSDMSNFFGTADDSGLLRRGIFDIWWSREYGTYSTATGKDITLTSWPVSDRMHVYIRKDYAAQIWPYGVGEATVLNPFTEVEVNQCAANWELRAGTIFDTADDGLSSPVGVSVDGDRVYVAEDFGHEISVYSTDGVFLESFGQQGTAAQEGPFFERPHSVDIGPDDNVYVVDTWNYRIRVLNPETYSQLASWGQAVTLGFDVQTVPVDGLWGPRDIAVDDQGRVYVSDTGNKRVRVYESDGTFVQDIGIGGTGDGELNEPAGLALHPDGRVYVADTWNRRVSVFNQDGSFNNNIEVRGWREELGNRPYIAIDAERGFLYVTDPDAGRILVYNTEGDCLGSFGQLNRENPSAEEFATIGGIAVDDAGNLYAVDMGAGRVLRFDPYQPVIVIDESPESPPIGGDGPGFPPMVPSDAESTAQVGPPFAPGGAGNDQVGPPPFAPGGESTDQVGPPFNPNPETTDEVEEAEE